MPSPIYFDRVAPFPEQTKTAYLPTLSLSQLQHGKRQEEEKLFDACRKNGFFSLDLRDCQPLIADAEAMFDLADKTFRLERDILSKYAYSPPKDLHGYKASGLLKTDDGKVDAVEMYNLTQDDVLGSTVPPRVNPPCIEERRADCRQFIEKAYGAITTILDCLDIQLGLAKGTLAQKTSLERPSSTSLRFTFTKPQSPQPKRITLGAHTDIGVITLLFNVAGGLQILPAGSENKDENWRFVRPQPYCALVNIGDTLVEWTGGVVCSSLHRVVTAPGEQSSVSRVSLAYLVRSAKGETMKRLESDGRIIPEADGDVRSVDEWASEKAVKIMKGILEARSSGGRAGANGLV